MNAALSQQDNSQRLPGGVSSAHTDRFIYTMMPPTETWPAFDYSGEILSAYPDYMNAAGVLLDTATTEGFGAKPVFHYEGQTWSYRKLQDTVDKIGRVLLEDYGLVPGNRVLLRSGNSPMLAACWLAVLKAGGICVTTMPLLKTEELVFILNRVRIRIALCEESLADELEAAGQSAEDLEQIACFTPLGVDKSKTADLDRAIEKKTTGFTAVRTAADDVALIAFTSGTTGNPKATVHFHRDLIAITDCYPRVHTVDTDDIICGSPSMAFTYGLAVLLIYPLRFRATVVIVPRPTPEQILAAIEQYRVNNLYCVPTSFSQMLEGLDQFDISSLQKCASSGENLQIPASDLTMATALRSLCVPFCQIPWPLTGLAPAAKQYRAIQPGSLIVMGNHSRLMQRAGSQSADLPDAVIWMTWNNNRRLFRMAGTSPVMYSFRTGTGISGS